jgi:hypothetical protein
MTNVAVIGCAPSDILSACQNTIRGLARGGHKVYAIIARSSESGSSSLPSQEIADISQLALINMTQTFPIEGFDYSAITQANADALNSIIKKVKPMLVIIPSWKSPDHKRKILARTALIACRGIGSILMYELDVNNNTSFTPTMTFQVSGNRSLVQQQQQLGNNSDEEVPKGSGGYYEPVQELFESHRSLLLEDEEEEGLF